VSRLLGIEISDAKYPYLATNVSFSTSLAVWKTFAPIASALGLRRPDNSPRNGEQCAAQGYLSRMMLIHPTHFEYIAGVHSGITPGHILFGILTAYAL
jgi:hypothetical protein